MAKTWKQTLSSSAPGACEMCRDGVASNIALDLVGAESPLTRVEILRTRRLGKLLHVRYRFRMWKAGADGCEVETYRSEQSKPEDAERAIGEEAIAGLRFADGTPYHQFGTTCYAWVHQPRELEEQTLRTLAAQPPFSSSMS